MSLDILRKIKSGLSGLVQSRESFLSPLESAVKFYIGTSILKESIDCYQIGGGEIKILFVSGIHGNEIGTVKLAYRLINFLNQKYSEFSRITFYVVPCLNLDGFAEAKKNPDLLGGGRVGRFNKKDVDLNRNFDTPSFQKESLWSFGKNYTQNVKVNCGEKGNSEPETDAVTKFILEKDIKVVFSFHNVGADVLAAKDVLSMKIANIYAQKACLKLMDEAQWLGLRQTGTFKEWCELNSVSFLEIETSKRWGSDWARQLPAIEACVAYISSGI